MPMSSLFLLDVLRSDIRYSQMVLAKRASAVIGTRINNLCFERHRTLSTGSFSKNIPGIPRQDHPKLGTPYIG